MLVVRALQLAQGVSLILTLTPLADVAPHVLLLGLVRLLSVKTRLQAYAPTCTTLIDPP
jgi:hypothetical protein